MANERIIRVLIAKPGLDGHDRGAKIVVRALRDAGFEVIYTGIRQTPEAIVRAAMQEDVQVVGLSVHSGTHVQTAAEVRKLMDEKGLGDILLLLGGIIPKQDIPALQKLNVKGNFGPGTEMEKIIECIQSNVKVVSE